MKKKMLGAKLTLKKKTIVHLVGLEMIKGGGPIKTAACGTERCISNLDTSPCVSVLIACESMQLSCDNEASFCVCTP